MSPGEYRLDGDKLIVMTSDQGEIELTMSYSQRRHLETLADTDPDSFQQAAEEVSMGMHDAGCDHK